MASLIDDGDGPDNPALWGYSSRGLGLPLTPQPAQSPFTLHLVGQTYPGYPVDIPTELDNVVSVHESLPFHDYYTFISECVSSSLSITAAAPQSILTRTRPGYHGPCLLSTEHVPRDDFLLHRGGGNHTDSDPGVGPAHRCVHVHFRTGRGAQEYLYERCPGARESTSTGTTAQGVREGVGAISCPDHDGQREDVEPGFEVCPADSHRCMC